MRNVFRHSDGKPFEYIKEVKELDGLVIVRFKGAIDSATIPIMRDNIKKYREKYLNINALIDFKDVTHVDSATLAGLILILNEREKHHAKLAIINISKLFRNYLKIERIESAIRVYSDEKSAIKALTAKIDNI